MITPNIWGHGQLFAFSALDGEAPMGDDFSGILCADKIGIRFFSRVRRELVITGKGRFLPSFETVTGDLITVNTKTGQVDILYAAAHLIIGSTTESTVVSVTVEGDCEFLSEDGIRLHDTGDGEVTALLKKGTRFAFAYGHSREEVKKLAAAGIDLPLDDIKSDRLKLYQQVSLGEEDPYARLYAKCLSVMKSQLYTPEGAIKRIWSTPDRLPHKRMWLWDSVFHAVGHRNWNHALAEDLILAVLDVQEDSGFIPHMAAPDMRSQIIQPPVIKLLTTKKERQIRMPYEAKEVSKTTRILFPIIITVIAGIVAPASVALVGFLMFGNLIRECGVLNSLSETAQKVLANLITIFLGITIASQMSADKFLNVNTLLILGLGLFAFIFDTAGGVLFAKFLNLFMKKKINPMIGAAGISAFPMSGRIVHKMGLEEDPQNFLLMHSIGVNVSGQIASVIAGGLILNFFMG